MEEIDIAGLKIHNFKGKNELLSEIEERVQLGKKTWITTVYSEFLRSALLRQDIMRLLNSADLSIADGQGIAFARIYLSLKFHTTNHFTKVIEAVGQMIYSLVSFLTGISKSNISVTPGRELIFDLCNIAQKQRLSMYLYGGFGETTRKTKEKLELLYPGIDIIGTSNKPNNDTETLREIQKLKPDILCVALGPISQETWIMKHINEIDCKIVIGLGGTFDYISGLRALPPVWVRRFGLEWLYRLLTQPHRYQRIWNAFFGLSISLIRYRVWSSYPLRQGVVAAVFNKENKILIGKTVPSRRKELINRHAKSPENSEYWQFPQGGIEPNEDPVAAAIRETTEETGLYNLTPITVLDRHVSYQLRNSIRRLISFRYPRISGQTHIIVALKFTGNYDAESNVRHTLPQEFSELRWVTIDELPRIVSDHKRAHTEAICEFYNQSFKSTNQLHRI